MTISPTVPPHWVAKNSIDVRRSSDSWSAPASSTARASASSLRPSAPATTRRWRASSMRMPARSASWPAKASKPAVDTRVKRQSAPSAMAMVVVPATCT